MKPKWLAVMLLCCLPVALPAQHATVAPGGAATVEPESVARLTMMQAASDAETARITAERLTARQLDAQSVPIAALADALLAVVNPRLPKTNQIARAELLRAYEFAVTNKTAVREVEIVR